MNPNSLPPARDAFLMVLGETIRTVRARRGMTRRMLATEAGVSERHLANLESGLGNASILVLRQVAQALGCPLAELVDAREGSSPEAALLRDLLRDRSEKELQRARVALARLFGAQSSEPERRRRIALIGLRGAGKSTLGRMLADHLGVSFIELNQEIARVGGCNVTEIHALYGVSAYRRYERRALEDIIRCAQLTVIATPGGLVSDAATFNRLLEHCFTVWLKASPEEHMDRVIAQGDNRPMAGNAEAMDDLRRILAGRSPFYAKADLAFDTSGQSLEQSFAGLRDAIESALAGEAIAGD
jgi:XRE family transcriptional regulator, aerobic/anaerobic benzoate catabolism transcriptional regulator